MLRGTLIALILLLSFFGLADSWYLAEHSLSGEPLSCNVTGLSECNIVAASPYSQFLGLPLSLYGVAFYTLIFVFGSLLIFVPTRAAYLSLMTFAALGFLASAYFIFLQLFVIQATCIYCITSAILSTLLFIIAFMTWQRYGPRARHA